MAKPLYDTDFYTWTQQQAALLREGKVHDLDLANLAEEIESLGKSDRRALEHQLERLMMHLLKWRYQPGRRSRSWRGSIWTARRAIQRLLRDNPSFWQHVPRMLQEDYAGVRKEASAETSLPLATFPEGCPWTQEQVLDDDFWPENTP
jgi:hypothetical protein